MFKNLTKLRCWWLGHEQHPQDSAPPDEATCMHCVEHVPYSDMVGDTRHNRAIDSMHRVWWSTFGRWLPHKCHACGERGKCKPNCDGIPF